MPFRRTRISIGISIFICAALVSVVAGIATQPSTASAQQAPVRNAGMEASFIAAVNQTRAQRGAGPLTQNAGMSSAALSWTYSMVSGTFLAHASDIVTGTPAGWSKVGENVGRGQTVQTLMIAFMNSPTHAANLLDPSYTHIGVGVYIHPNGKVYTTHRFASLPGAAAAPAISPAPTATSTLQAEPTAAPTVPPTPVPTAAPTAAPTVPPTPVPTAAPTAAPTVPPTPVPTAAPTAAPTVPTPTEIPPTAVPTPPAASNASSPTAAASSPDDGFGQAPEQLAFSDEGTSLSPELVTPWFERIQRLFAKRSAPPKAKLVLTIARQSGIR